MILTQSSLAVFRFSDWSQNCTNLLSMLFIKSNVLKNMNNKRLNFVNETSVEDYVESMDNKNTKEKTKQDVKLLDEFLTNEQNDEQEVYGIAPVELNKCLAEFIRSVIKQVLLNSVQITNFIRQGRYNISY